MKWLPRLPASVPPRRALILGKIVFLTGAILVLGAVFARGSLGAINVERVEAKLPALRTLAEAYPQYPTWVVPEGPVGFTVSAILVLVGLALIVMAEEAAQVRAGSVR
jgi:hypothetical protein